MIVRGGDIRTFRVIAIEMNVKYADRNNKRIAMLATGEYQYISFIKFWTIK